MTKEGCPHLDKLVNDPPSISVNAIPVEKIDKFYYESGAGIVVPKEVRDRVFEMQFRAKLKKAGVNTLRTNILVLRFCYDASLQEIAEEMNFVSASTVLRIMNQSLKYLKKQGFK